MRLPRLCIPVLTLVLIGAPTTVIALSPAENEPPVNGQEPTSDDPSELREPQRQGSPSSFAEHGAKRAGVRTPQMPDNPSDRVIRPSETTNR